MLRSFQANVNFLGRMTSSRSVHKQQSPLYLLRQKTGLAYNLCREALDKHDNNVEKASAWLEAQAISLGLQKATKLQNRSARQGLVGMSVNRNNKLVTVVELNCETDFVAKNQVFKDFAISIIEQLSPLNNNLSEEPGKVQVSTPSKVELEKIDSQIPPIISKLGENIRLAYAKHYQIIGQNSYIFGQIHAQSCSKETSNADIFAGRFGAIVGLSSENQSSDIRRLRQIGNRLCQHVIGYNPTYIELPPEVREHLEKEEATKTEKEKEATNEVKEDEDYSDTEEEQTTNSRDDWPSIMDQTLILSQDQSVREFCHKESLSIVYFNRMECGQIQ